MGLSDIERIVVDFFEANGAEVEMDAGGSGEFFLDGFSLVDAADISLTALAAAIHASQTPLNSGDQDVRLATNGNRAA